jgi:hypothetical protein
MLYFLISLVVLVGFLDRSARKSRIDLLMTETRFRLFAIRDELRLAVMEEEIANDKWFDYLDTSLTKMVDLLPKLSLWQLVVLMVHYRNDQRMMRGNEELMEFVQDKDNKRFSELFGKYLLVVGEFLFRRHRVISLFFVGALRTAKRVTTAKEEAAAIVATAPETSTFFNYCEV